MLESGEPEDIIDAKELDVKLQNKDLDIKLNNGSDSEIPEVLKVVSINDEDEEDDVLFFKILNWRNEDDEEMCVLTRAAGGRIDPDIMDTYREVRFYVYMLYVQN